MQQHGIITGTFKGGCKDGVDYRIAAPFPLSFAFDSGRSIATAEGLMPVYDYYILQGDEYVWERFH